MQNGGTEALSKEVLDHACAVVRVAWELVVVPQCDSSGVSQSLGRSSSCGNSLFSISPTPCHLPQQWPSYLF